MQEGFLFGSLSAYFAETHKTTGGYTKGTCPTENGFAGHRNASMNFARNSAVIIIADERAMNFVSKLAVAHTAITNDSFAG